MRWSLLCRCETHHFPVPGTFEFLKDQARPYAWPVAISAVATIVREPASSVLNVPPENLRGISFHGTAIDHRHSSSDPSAAHGIITGASRSRDQRVEQDNTCFPGFYTALWRVRKIATANACVTF